jgi:hypothetical protein
MMAPASLLAVIRPLQAAMPVTDSAAASVVQVAPPPG